jgi:hypothetical protein
MNDTLGPVRKALFPRCQIIAYTAVLLLVSACATQPTGKVSFDDTHDFSDYRTFAWISEHPMRVGPAVADPRDSIEPMIMAAIRLNLENKGFRFIDDASTPDFVVSFTVGSREKARPEGYADPKAGTHWSWGTDYQAGAVGATYTQGVLAIDILDSAERRRVWHGVAARRIDEQHLEDMGPVIDSVTGSILAGFPPR